MTKQLLTHVVNHKLCVQVCVLLLHMVNADNKETTHYVSLAINEVKKHTHTHTQWPTHYDLQSAIYSTNIWSQIHTTTIKDQPL